MRKAITLDELDDFLDSAVRGTTSAEASAEAAVAWSHDHQPAPADPWLLPEPEAHAVFLAAFQRMLQAHSEPDHLGEASPGLDYRRTLQIEGSPLAVWEYDYHQLALRACPRSDGRAEVLVSVHRPSPRSPSNNPR